MSHPNQPPQGGYDTYNEPHCYSYTPSEIPPPVTPPPAKKQAPLWLGFLILGAIAAVCVAGAFYAFSGGDGSDSAGAVGGPVVADTPPLQAAADGCSLAADSNVDIGDGGRSISISRAGLSTGPSLSLLACLLERIETPDAVIARIENTRALDGMQTGEWNSYSASWTYHPDDGLNMVIEHQQ